MNSPLSSCEPEPGGDTQQHAGSAAASLVQPPTTTSGTGGSLRKIHISASRLPAKRRSPAACDDDAAARPAATASRWSAAGGGDDGAAAGCSRIGAGDRCGSSSGGLPLTDTGMSPADPSGTAHHHGAPPHEADGMPGQQQRVHAQPQQQQQQQRRDTQHRGRGGGCEQQPQQPGTEPRQQAKQSGGQPVTTDSEDDSWTPEQPQSSSGEQQPAVSGGGGAGTGGSALAAEAAAEAAAPSPSPSAADAMDVSAAADGAGDGADAVLVSSGSEEDADIGDADDDAGVGCDGCYDDVGGDEFEGGEGFDPDAPPPVYCTNCTARMFSTPECFDCGHSSEQDGELLQWQQALDSPAGGEAAAGGAAAAQQAVPSAPAAAAGEPLGPADTPPGSRPVIIWDDGMLLHEEGKLEPHPERPDRLRAIIARLGTTGLSGECQRVPARRATKAELLRVHTPDHLHRLQLFCSGAVPPSAIPSDTYINSHTLDCAALAAGSAAEAALRVWQGEADRGAAIIRPPGHHAESNTAMGFCFFNNAAVAARAVQDAGAERVLIFDWDIHHGNGTQHIFEGDPSVLYVSLHRYDRGTFYPGTGGAHEVGTGRGTGFTVNVPWDAPDMADGDYMAAMEQVLLPIVREFAPDLTLISAGFDAAAGDPIGGCAVSAACFGAMTAALMPLARTVLLLEGGYNLRATAEATEACVRVLLGVPAPPLPDARPSPWGWLGIQAARRAHGRYWTCLAGPPPHNEGMAAAAELAAAAGLTLRGHGHHIGNGEQELRYDDDDEYEEAAYDSDDEQQEEDDEEQQQQQGSDEGGAGASAGAAAPERRFRAPHGWPGNRLQQQQHRPSAAAVAISGGSSPSKRRRLSERESSLCGSSGSLPGLSRKQQILKAIHHKALVGFWRRRAKAAAAAARAQQQQEQHQRQQQQDGEA